MASVEVQRLDPEDEEVAEEWARVTDEEDILGVSAARLNDSAWPWQVFVNVAEFIRDEPLEFQLINTITEALSQLGGVTAVAQEDREVWLVKGDVRGDALVHACGEALDRLADDHRAALDAM